MVVHPDSERVMDVARAGFRRVLTSWAMEVMSLRRRGLHRPGLVRLVEEEWAEPCGESPARELRVHR